MYPRLPPHRRTKLHKRTKLPTRTKKHIRQPPSNRTPNRTLTQTKKQRWLPILDNPRFFKTRKTQHKYKGGRIAGLFNRSAELVSSNTAAAATNTSAPASNNTAASNTASNAAPATNTSAGTTHQNIKKRMKALILEDPMDKQLYIVINKMHSDTDPFRSAIQELSKQSYQFFHPTSMPKKMVDTTTEFTQTIPR